MRIAFVINDLSGGGAEKVLQLLSGFLIDRGHEIKVILLQSGNDAYELPAAVESVVLRSGRLCRGVGKVFALPLAAVEIARLLRRWNPEVCVSNMPRSNVAHVMSRWFGNKLPVVITEHIATWDNYPSSRPADRIMRSMIRRHYPRADAVIAVSRGVAEGLRGFGVDAARVHVQHNPISLDAIRERAELASGLSEASRVPTVITVGRLAEQKDHHTLLRAFALVRRQMEARLILVGEGPLRADLSSLVQQLGIVESVEFAGWQDNPFALLESADLFVLSSRYEGFGNVLVEAMACGLPVVSTDCPSGPSEILQDGAAGLLVPVGDANALADAMTSVLMDRELRDRLVAEAHRRAPEFDISVIGPEYESLLRSFVAAPRDGIPEPISPRASARAGGG